MGSFKASLSVKIDRLDFPEGVWALAEMISAIISGKSTLTM